MIGQIWVACHQVPPVAVVIHALGLFYYWHLFNVIPVIGKIVCVIG